MNLFYYSQFNFLVEPQNLAEVVYPRLNSSILITDISFSRHFL